MNKEEIELVKSGERDYEEKWIPVPETSEIYKSVVKIISENTSNIKLKAICKVKEHGHYVCSVYGGLNGGGKWTNYFTDFKTIFEKLGDAWLIDIENDCLDDLWSARFCFRK